jgi:hypothetical protein
MIQSYCVTYTYSVTYYTYDKGEFRENFESLPAAEKFAKVKDVYLRNLKNYTTTLQKHIITEKNGVITVATTDIPIN